MAAKTLPIPKTGWKCAGCGNTNSKLKAKSCQFCNAKRQEAAPEPKLLPTAEIKPIPLDHLDLWEHNVRVLFQPDAIEEMATAIEKHGLIHELTVVDLGNGRYGVAAGGRRYRGLKRLVERGVLDPDAPIRCKIEPDPDKAREISLSENVSREDLDPIDQALAFAGLVADGSTVDELEVRFAKPAAYIRQRLKLASINPQIIDEYRKGRLNLQEMIAFTLTDDQQRQWQAWEDIQDRHRSNWASYIRGTLLPQGGTWSSDKRALFVGLDAYRAAGGRVQEDLFSNGQQNVYLEDGELLTRLYDEKLATAAEEIAAKEDWHFVTPVPYGQEHWEAQRGFTLEAEEPSYTPEQEAKRKALEAEHEKLSEVGYDEDINETEEEEETRLARIEALEDELQEMEEDAIVDWSAETRAIGGVFVSVTNDGKLKIERGWVPRGQSARSTGSASSGSSARTNDKPKSLYSRPLVESLTLHKTAVIAAELAQSPEVALAGVIYSLMASASTMQSAINITGQTAVLSANKLAGNRAYADLIARTKKWQEKFPPSTDLWGWLVSLPTQEKLDLLAVLSAWTLNAKQEQSDYYSKRHEHADRIANTLDVKIEKWFTPTGDNFFSKVSKSLIILALREANVDPGEAPHTMKKGELVSFAENAMVDAGWVPPPMRIQPVKEEKNTDSARHHMMGWSKRDPTGTFPVGDDGHVLDDDDEPYEGADLGDEEGNDEWENRDE